MKARTRTQFESDRTGPAVALGFFVIGILCLIASLGILSIHPQIAGGEPYRTEVVAFAALVSFGFVGSFVFGAAYVISPIMATHRLFSERLAMVHLLFHGVAIGWLLVTYGGMQFLENPRIGFFIGIGLLLVGALVFIFNLLTTASKLNRWEPEQLTLMAALFWLGITAVLGISLLLAPWMPAALHDPMELLQAHAPLALVGFLWLSLLGFSLKLFKLFLVSEKTASVLSWIGWVCVNAALMIFVPVLLHDQAVGGRGVGVTMAMALLCIGSFCYLADIVRLWLAAQRPVNWALTGAFIGLLGGFALLAWALVGMPFTGAKDNPSEIREVTFVFFVVGIFGSFTLTMLGLGMRLIPFLIWQLRCAPLAEHERVPQPADLVGHGAGVGLTICLVAAWIYLAIGQWTQSAVGAQLGAVCLFCGLYWFLWSLRPSLKVFVFGIPPTPR
jgi:hypothetical protein